MFIFKRLSGIECQIPRGFVFEHGVEDDQEFAQASGLNDLEFLAAFFQTFSEGFDGGVMSGRGESRHVEHGSDGGSSAGDVSSALVSSAVVVERSDSDQRRDLLAVEFAQFGEFRQECGGGDLSQAGRALQDLRLVAPVVVGVDELGDGGVHDFDLRVERLEHLVQTLASVLRRVLRDRLLPTIGLHRAEVQELPAAHDQVGQFLLLLRHFPEHSRIDVLRELGQHLRVEPIGLGENAQTFGEVPHLPRIDDRDAIPGFEQFGDHVSFVTAGGFEDDGRALARRQCFKQLPKPRRSILDRAQPHGVRRGTSDFQRILGDIQSNPSDDRNVFHVWIPSLRMRARHGLRRCAALAAVRAEKIRPTGISLGYGVLNAKGYTISDRPLGAFLRAGLRSPARRNTPNRGTTFRNCFRDTRNYFQELL